MISASRAMFFATVLATLPVAAMTGLTLRSIWEQAPVAAGVVAIPTPADLVAVSLSISDGPDVLQVRADAARKWPVYEFFQPGFLPAIQAADPNSDWQSIQQSHQALARARQAVDITDRHVGRKALPDLPKDRLTQFADELQPLATAGTPLGRWPQLLRDLSLEAAATKVMRAKLESVTRDLDAQVTVEVPVLIRIGEADMKLMQQRLDELKRPVGDSEPVERYPALFAQYESVKRRLDFWEYWTPPANLPNGSQPDLKGIVKRREELQKKLNGRSKPADPDHPEEAAQIAKFEAEILRMAGEERYLEFQDWLNTADSEKTHPAKEFLEKLGPLVESGARQKEVQARFRDYVERSLPEKKTITPGVELYDFELPDGKIWLAHWDGKILPGNARFVSPYNPVTKKRDANGEVLLYADGGFTAVSKPEELRIVEEYNKTRKTLLERLDRQDAWTALMKTCVTLEQLRTDYYRRMTRHRNLPDDKKLRLAPELSFDADQAFLETILDRWSIVQPLYAR